MKTVSTNPRLHYYEDTLWRNPWLHGRSEEFSPLYMDRYRGPCQSGLTTSHDYWELTCVISGRGMLLGKTELDLRANTLCLMPPNVPHHERGAPVLDIIWMGFRSTRLKARDLKEAVSVSSRPLREFVESVWRFSARQGIGIGPELDGMIAAAVAWFLRILSEGMPAAGTSAVERALQFLRHHFTEDVSMAGLARQAGYSEGAFYRAFKKLAGYTPLAYLTRLRIRQAERLLRHTDSSMAEIARWVGCKDQFYFSRRFRAIMGIPPSEYRAQRRRHDTNGDQPAAISSD